jgi:fused signal recognition particle receptor
MFLFFKKTFNGLSKTRKKLANAISGLTGKSYLDADDIELLEESLLEADLGWQVVESVIEELQDSGNKDMSWDERFMQTMSSQLKDKAQKYPLKKVIVLIGINGTGKTTSSAKLASYFSNDNEKVILVAADTYRAAAVEQIREWATRLKINLVANEATTDPAAVAYDGVNSGLAKNMDRIIVDTAGRLHTSPNLMQELEKINRVIKKITDDISVLITIDANTGQNGITQVKEFEKYIPIDGVILTKMDGTARGGIAVSIMTELNLPIYFMGVGEQVDDLIPFDRNSYLKGLIGMGEEASV